VKIDEGYLDVPGGKVWYRAVGDNAEATPLLCLHGGPGFTHYYLEPLEALADRRRVIFYDQRLRALGSPGRPLLVKRGPVRNRTRPGPFGPQS